MSHKRKGQLTMSGEWRKHLRPDWRRIYWKGERQAEKREIRNRLDPPRPLRRSHRDD